MIKRGKLAYSKEEVADFLHEKKADIQQVIHDIITEYEIDIYSKKEHTIDTKCIKAILYEYINVYDNGHINGNVNNHQEE
jgi:hypothetical protein